MRSRDREVFSTLIELHSDNHHLMGDLSRVITFMCRLQPPEFVFVSFAVELDRFVTQKICDARLHDSNRELSRELGFISSFVQQLCHVLLTANEAKQIRDVLKDCIGNAKEKEVRKSRIFHILLSTFSHNLIATTSLCLWGGAFRSAYLFLQQIDPLDISLVFLVELDKLVELIERPLFR